MKYTNRQAFEKHLESSYPQHLAEVYLLICDDSYEKEQGYKALVSVFKRQPKELKVLSGHKLAPEHLQNELYSFSLFSRESIVVIQDVEGVKGAAKEMVEKALEKPLKGITLILTAESLASNTIIYKRVEKSGVILDLKGEKTWEKEKRLLEWVQHLVKRAGKEMSGEAAKALLHATGANGALLEKEVEKLLCYVGEGSAISLHDVEELCPKVSEESVWQLAEAIFSLDVKRALNLGQALLAQGEALLGLLRLLRGQFQTTYHVHTILAAGGTEEHVSAQFPYLRGSLLQKQIHQASTFGEDRLRRGLLLIDEAELMAKNSSIDPELLLETLMIKAMKKYV